MGKSLDSIITQPEDYNPSIILNKGDFQVMCLKCNFRLEKNTVCKNKCPDCLSQLYIVSKD